MTMPNIPTSGSLPGILPRWATDTLYMGNPTKVDPGAAKRDTGFIVDEKPAAEYMNQLINEMGTLLDVFRNQNIVNMWHPVSAMDSPEAIVFVPWLNPSSPNAFVAGADSGSPAIWSGDRIPGLTLFGTFQEEVQNRQFSAEALPGLTGNDLIDIAHDESANIVAVGSRGNIVQSTDGSVWNDRSPGGFSTGVSDDIHFVIWDAVNGLFVAGGSGGEIATSPTGVTWTQRTTPATDVLNAIDVDAAGFFVAVGASGVIWTSPDGIAWTARTNPEGSTALASVRHNRNTGTWIAVGGTGDNTNEDPVVLHSTDGITWVQRGPVLGLTADTAVSIENDGGSQWLLSLAMPTTAPVPLDKWAISYDEGVTWERVVLDLGSTNGGRRLQYYRRRYAALNVGEDIWFSHAR